MTILTCSMSLSIATRTAPTTLMGLSGAFYRLEMDQASASELQQTSSSR